jgi:hypothetical protein
MIVPWGTVGTLYAWNEHASTDASNSFIVWSSSAGPTANSYDGSQPTFGNCGAGCTGNLPLDKWVAVIPRYTDSAGYPHIGQIANAYQLTSVNVRGSPDRAIVCAADGGCNPDTVFSGGYADYSQANTITELIKDVSGNAALYGIALLTQTTRVMGAVKLTGAVTLK